MRRTLTVMAGIIALAVGTMGAALASTMLAPFTQAELDTNWEADREFPTGGVTSVTAFDRNDVARLGIDSEETATDIFRRTEGIKTVGDQNFGEAVQVDLYLDPDWQGTAVRAGFWVVGDDGAGDRDDLFAIIEFVNNELCDPTACSNQSNITDHEGFRIWDTAVGWTNVEVDFSYGTWVTLTITLDTTGVYFYAIDGVEVGNATGGENFIREVFLNSYNYGEDTFPTLSSDSYAAHWHAGFAGVDSRDDCKDGEWEAAGFENQGQCIRFVNTGQDSR